MSAKIEVQNLIKVFGKEPHKALALLAKGAGKDRILAETDQTLAGNNVSFTVSAGEIFVIMGASGSGKSTVLRCLNRLIEPDSGSVAVDGEEMTKLDVRTLNWMRQNKLAMVFQQFGLLPHRTVLENAAFALEVRGKDRPEREETARKYLKLVGLAGWEDSYPSDLSGGMKQRVGLARALTAETEIILMDEAFSALDPLIRQELQGELLNLQERMNKTIVFVTHDFKEAVRLADRIAFFRDGCVVQIGTPKEIVADPADHYVEKFVRGLAESKEDDVRVPPAHR